MYEQPEQPQQPPFETPYIPYAPPTPPKKENNGLKRAGVILLVFIALAAGGVSAYAMVKNSSLKDELANEKAANKALKDENSKLKKTGQTAQPAAKTITETLPNGKKMTYPDTEGNRNVLWWSASPDINENGDVIALSHKGAQQFLATVDSDIVTDVCGTDDALRAVKYNVVFGNFNTTNKELGDSENVSCVALLATDENTDETSRDQAKKVIETIKNDIAAFVKSVVIK